MGWQLSSGIGGRLPLDSMAALHWNRWQESPEYAPVVACPRGTRNRRKRHSNLTQVSFSLNPLNIASPASMPTVSILCFYEVKYLSTGFLIINLKKLTINTNSIGRVQFMYFSLY